MSINRIITTAFLSTLILGLASCSGGKKSESEKSEEVLPDDIVELRDDQAKLANIQYGSIQLCSLNNTLKVNGTVAVAPQNMATVCMPMGGFVKSTLLMPGNAVRKGQRLAILENQEFVDIQQNYLEAKNKFEYASAEYARNKQLYKEDVSSQKSFQQVTADYKSLKAQVRAFEQKLIMIGINPHRLHEDNISRSVAVVSPISGFVKSVNVNVGKFVQPSDVLFEIENRDKLLLELTLFEKDADKVSNGQQIKFYINNETEEHQAIISQTGKSIGSDKTYKVYANVKTSCKNILPGMYVNAVIEASGNKVNALPTEAIVSFSDKDYIFVFSKTKKEKGKPFTEYRMVEVTKGLTSSGFTEVYLPAGFDIRNSRVVVKGAYNLLAAKKNAGEMAC